jgi:hypothetical protein
VNRAFLLHLIRDPRIIQCAQEQVILEHLHLLAYSGRQLCRRLEVLSDEWDHAKDGRDRFQCFSGRSKSAHVQVFARRPIR